MRSCRSPRTTRTTGKFSGFTTPTICGGWNLPAAGGAEGMGFCLLNNAAIAARHLQAKHGVSKVMIIDWDVHHGNGTQSIFWEDPSVFYFSIHENPAFLYPGTGRRWQPGEGGGVGATLHAPM